jgi:hypothetical protein
MLRAQVQARLVALWRSLGSWRNDMIPVFVKQAVAIVTAAINQTAMNTSVGLQRFGEASGVPIASAGGLDGYVRAGVTPEDVYERPFHDMWTALSQGKTVQQAVQVASDRLATRAATDLQLAKTQTAQATFLATGNHIVGYRRVLEGSYSCGLCIVASTRLYHRADLLPIHPACDCSVFPVISTQKDPGPLLNAGTLADVHNAIAEAFGADSPAAKNIPGLFNAKGVPVQYRGVLISHHHNEIGPVLARKKSAA